MYVCVYLQVCVLCELSCRGPILRRFSTCITSTPKPLDSTKNSEAENVEAESAAIDRLLSCRARLSALDLWYSTELHCSYCFTFTYTHFDSVTLCDLCSPHTGVFRCKHAADILELPQASATDSFGPHCLFLLHCECFSCHRYIVLE